TITWTAHPIANLQAVNAIADGTARFQLDPNGSGYPATIDLRHEVSRISNFSTGDNFGHGLIFTLGYAWNLGAGSPQAGNEWTVVMGQHQPTRPEEQAPLMLSGVRNSALFDVRAVFDSGLGQDASGIENHTGYADMLSRTPVLPPLVSWTPETSRCKDTPFALCTQDSDCPGYCLRWDPGFRECFSQSWLNKATGGVTKHGPWACIQTTCTCTSNTDCGSPGGVCTSGLCTTAGTGTPARTACTADAQCNTGFKCGANQFPRVTPQPLNYDNRYYGTPGVVFWKGGQVSSPAEVDTWARLGGTVDNFTDSWTMYFDTEDIRAADFSAAGDQLFDIRGGTRGNPWVPSQFVFISDLRVPTNPWGIRPPVPYAYYVTGVGCDTNCKNCRGEAGNEADRGYTNTIEPAWR